MLMCKHGTWYSIYIHPLSNWIIYCWVQCSTHSFFTYLTWSRFVCLLISFQTHVALVQFESMLQELLAHSLTKHSFCIQASQHHFPASGFFCQPFLSASKASWLAPQAPQVFGRDMIEARLFNQFCSCKSALLVMQTLSASKNESPNQKPRLSSRRQDV